MRRNKQPPSFPVRVQIDGKPYAGSYYVDRRTITVTYGIRKKTTQLGGSSPDGLARILLGELVRADPSLI